MENVEIFSKKKIKLIANDISNEKFDCPASDFRSSAVIQVGFFVAFNSGGMTKAQTTETGWPHIAGTRRLIIVEIFSLWIACTRFT
jgi:hypothetical protein